MVRQRTPTRLLIADTDQIEAIIRTLGSDYLQVAQQRSIEILDRYFDTQDWQVLKSGWSYCWHESGGRRCVQLHAATGRRDERRSCIEQAVESFQGSPACLDEAVMDTHLSGIDLSRLEEFLRVRIRRQMFELQTDEGTLIDASVDQVTIKAARSRRSQKGRMRFGELTLDLKHGPEVDLRRMLEAHQTRFALVDSKTTNFARGLQCAGRSLPRRHQPEVQELERHVSIKRLVRKRPKRTDPLVSMVHRYLILQFEQLMLHEPRAWEGMNPEGVHQMRVATRRLRAALRTFRKVVPKEEAKRFRNELKSLASVLGRVRDLDVFEDTFSDQLEHLDARVVDHVCGYLQHARAQRKAARSELIAFLESPRYQMLKHDFATFLGGDLRRKNLRKHQGRSVSRAAQKMITRGFDDLVACGREIRPDSPDHLLHGLRIDCKRMRYLLEFYRPALGDSLKPFIRSLTQLQDVLGEFQDACVATDRLQQYAEQIPMQPAHRSELLAIGQLIGNERRTAQQRRSEFKRAWSRFDRRRVRKQLRTAVKAVN